MTPTLHARQLLTIICEADIERQLVADLRSRGVRGYTITDARGHGKHGDRDALWPASANIRIEALCDSHILSATLIMLEENYFKNHGLVAFVSEVAVLRADKF